MKDMYFRGWTAIEHHSLSGLANRENLPCCSYVAMWVIDVAESFRGNSMLEYAKLDREWWARANVYDPRLPWSAIDTAKEKLSGESKYVDLVSSKINAPSLTPYRWHVVQRWRNLELNEEDMQDDLVITQGRHRSTGHTYLAYAGDDRGYTTIVQSSVSKGYRVSRGIWRGTAGLDGYSVAVLTLPE